MASSALDELEEALQEWIDSEKSRVENEVSYLKKVREGLTDSSTLRGANTDRAEIFTLAEIQRFLEDT